MKALISRTRINRWSITQRVGSGFTLVLLIVLALAAVAFLRFATIDRTSATLATQDLPSTLVILEVQQALKENFGYSQTLHSASDPAAIEARIHKNITTIDRLLQEFPQYINDEETRVRFEAFATLRAAWVRSFKELMRLQKAGLRTEASAWVGSDVLPAYDAANAGLTALTESNIAGLDAANRAVRHEVELGVHTLLWGVITAFVAALLTALVICRGIARQLKAAAETLASGASEVTSAASQVSTASQSLAAGASEQAAALEETSASTEELASTIHQNADLGATAQKVAATAVSAAEASMKKADRLNAAMSDLRLSNTEIAKIVKTIDEIAFQTNLLALNAAVEAARAGEAGAGFSVVADEVRSLARRSAVAARETSEKIKLSLNNSDEGIKVAAEVVQDLTTINGRMRELEKFVGEVGAAAQEQDKGITQISQAMSQMDKVTQANAAAAEESASAAEELAAQALYLGEVVRTIGQLAGSRAKPPAATERVTPQAARELVAAELTSS